MARADFGWAQVGLLLTILAACDSGPPDQGVETIPDAGPAVLDRITRAADGGGSVHLVRLVQRGDQYAFDPAELEIPSGDVLRFVMTGSQPESIVFDTVGTAPEAAGFIRSNALHQGVLLTEPGQAYDVSFREAPSGRYPFLSLPHATHGMRGVVVVHVD